MSEYSELLTRTIENHQKFFSYRCEEVKLAPAGFVFLGDHTHYNEGLLIGCAVDFYSGIILKKRDDDLIKLKIAEGPLLQFDVKSLDIGCSDFKTLMVLEILKVLKDRDLLLSGFDCYLEVNTPHCCGLGYYSSIVMGFLNCYNINMNYSLDINELIEVGYKAQQGMIGGIANKAILLASLIGKEDTLVYLDLRKKEPTLIPLEGKKYKIVIFDTGEEIENPRLICNERIEECNVGVKGLRLYIWGIRNLRDIKPDFLARHIHMIPRRVYNRCLYNVDERIRVERVMGSGPADQIESLGLSIFESHKSLSELYDLSTQKLDYLVKKALDSKEILGAKMISCSSFRSIFTLVEETKVDSAIDLLSKLYSEKYGGALNTFVLNITNGILK